MKIAYDSYNRAPVYPVPAAKTPAVPTESIGAEEETAAIWELSGESRKAWTSKEQQSASVEETALSDAKSGDVKDDSGPLTRRLVAAESQEEVRTILSEAFKNMGDVRLAAMSGDPKIVKQALAALKRLTKLISRSQRKLGDLDKEDLIRLKAKRAEKRGEEMRLRELRAELQRRQLERKQRERKYLRDVDKPKEDDSPRDNRPSIAALQAQFIALQAQLSSMAQVSVGTEAAAAEGGAALSEGGGEVGGEALSGGEAASDGA